MPEPPGNDGALAKDHSLTAAAACQSHRLDGSTVGARKLESGGDCARQRPAELPPGRWMRGRHARARPSHRIGCRPLLGLVARAGRPGRLTVVSHQVGKCRALIGLSTLGDARPARDLDRNSPTCARPWISTCRPAAGTSTRRVVGGYVEGRSGRVAVEVVDLARTSGVRVLGMSRGCHGVCGPGPMFFAAVQGAGRGGVVRGGGGASAGHPGTSAGSSVPGGVFRGVHGAGCGRGGRGRDCGFAPLVRDGGAVVRRLAGGFLRYPVGGFPAGR